MEQKFWLDKWASNQIGFHENSVHPLLHTYWSQVVSRCRQQSEALQRQNVFVPLCGKSLDLLWLRDQGHHVFGIELSKIAVEAFFAENNLTFEKSTHASLDRYDAEHITLWCGDYFELQPDMVPPVSLFYDRAALIALDPGSRNKYLDHLMQLLTSDAHGLLITVEYDEHLVNPPPHSMPPQLVAVISTNSFSYEPFGTHAAQVKGKPCIEHALLMTSKVKSG